MPDITTLNRAILLLAAAAAALALHNGLRSRRALRGRRFGRFVEVGGARLHVIEDGLGAPLLLLHGNGASAEDFTTSGIFGKAAASYRVVAFDRPGFGGSSRPIGRVWSATAQADLIDAAAAKLGIGRYLVLGHSWGATVALEMARRHPGTVAGVVLVSGYHYPPPRYELALSALPAMALIGTAFRHTLLPPLVRLGWAWSMRKIFGPAAISATFAAAMKELASRPSQLRSIAAESYLMWVAALVARPRYDDIPTPVGIIAGAGDKLFDAPAEALRLHAELPNSLVDIVPDAGHMVHQTAPQVVLAMIDKIAALSSTGDAELSDR
ncbi:alpha/beta hydrolase [Mesorhizobium sp. WSM4904]|uniref:alpha/beta fold hydrolase n=1 Tax=Mesorhizobium sp. WSM4904 TaxID=3038545 RepID=UPI0024185875|nr:alpha/beta hydrolase [Mesorhizobium sp. WSM4904]WFP62202.1 alpha/beta hydrolase [Mesorhizobium sp. WSM4904]